jgi:hypothetical protein
METSNAARSASHRHDRPASPTIADFLSDGARHRCGDITALVAPAFELQPETVSKLLQGIVITIGLDRNETTGQRTTG